MPDELYVPQSEPLKRLFRNPTRSKYMTWYLWFSLIFHSFVLIRAWYIITQMAYSLGQWEGRRQFLLVISIILLVITGLCLVNGRRVHGWIVYLLNILYVPAFIFDMPNFMEPLPTNKYGLFWGNSDHMVYLMFVFGVVHIIIVPIYTVVQLIRRFKNRSHSRSV